MARRILVVGGGFSGFSTIAELVRQANESFSILWFDEQGAFGKGIAYGQDYPHYLLNVRADRMGLFADAPDGFYTWLQQENDSSPPGAYLSRALYGRYLQAMLAATLEEAKQKKISIERACVRLVDASLDSQGIQVSASNGVTYTGDLMVLATGNADAKRFSWVQPEAKNYLASLWEENAWDNLCRQAFAHPDLPILLVGTGLTMVDATLRLARELPNITVIALSRHGLLPRAHSNQIPVADAGWRMPQTPMTASALMRFLRSEAKKALQKNIPWQHWMDALRPDTVALWRRLRVEDQKRVLRHAFSWWNVHRHRIPATAMQTLEQRQTDNVLRIIAGRVQNVVEAEKGLEVTLEKGNKHSPMRVSVILNCTGPQMNIRQSGNPLIMALEKKDALRASANGLGVEITDMGTARGNWKDRLYPIGPLLTGADLETTAVPEIRKRAAELARSILSGQ